MIYIIGPGHGGPGLVANTYLEGSYSEIYPHIEQNKDGIKRLFRQFSWPYGIPSHVAPETPGSIHEGGELGYSLVHAYGAAFDNPDLIVACVVGDGEAETGPLATSWHSNKFLNPATDGAVLPILHLNGYKIANPTDPGAHSARRARRPDARLRLRALHVSKATIRRSCISKPQPSSTPSSTASPRSRKLRAKTARPTVRHGPCSSCARRKAGPDRKFVDGKPVEKHVARASGTASASCARSRIICACSKTGCAATSRDELFDEKGAFRAEFADIAPKGRRRMGMNAHANGGLLLQPLKVPNFRDFAVKIEGRGQQDVESTRVLGHLLHAVMQANKDEKNFRVFGPDETASNRLQDVITGTGKAGWPRPCPSTRTFRRPAASWKSSASTCARAGSKATCSPAATASSPATKPSSTSSTRWSTSTPSGSRSRAQIPWRKPIASLNYLLSSLVWRQDHNGFSHQDPGFIDHLLNKKADVVRIYLPPDANTLLSVADHCLRSRNYINLIVAGKQPAPQWLTIDEAIAHCTTGSASWHVGLERRRQSRSGHGLLRRRAHHGNSGRRHACCASAFPTCASAWSTSWT